MEAVAVETVNPRTEPVTVRELKPAEFYKLATLPPFNTDGIPAFGHTRVLVAETENKTIVGYWIIFDAVHVEPVWVAEEYRKRPGLARRGWKKVWEMLSSANVPYAFATILDRDAMPNESLALRLGFTRLPGALYCIRVKTGRES